MDLADPLVKGQFTGKTELPVRSLLGPKLKHCAMLVTCLAQGLVFGQAQAHRFFQVYIFACSGRSQCVQHMPVVGARYQNRVDIVTGQKLAEVVIFNASLAAIAALDLFSGGGSRSCLYVADRYDLGVVLVQEVPHHTTPLIAYADTAHHNSIARRNAPGLAQRRGRNYVWETYCANSSACCLLQELTTICLLNVHNQIS
jgi:hypothetical protein